MSYSAPTTWFGRFSLLLVALVDLIALLGGGGVGQVVENI